ncbi:NAD(P)/FAD-dependent oxidoreductase [Trinickia terrae]|nr:FAD-dependent oxidoreductase [Trinickia terrae]
MHEDAIVIVGAGLAGARASVELREAGYANRIVLIGGEAHAPYDRPPLSKAVLAGQKTIGECALFAEGVFAQHAIDVQLDRRVVEIDRSAHRVVLDDGSTVSYRKLLIATGAEPRQLAVNGALKAGVMTLRTADDARSLAARLSPGQRLAIVGGGFIGLEVAASACGMGCDVTVIEEGQRVLMRAVPPAIAARIEARHRAAGVRFRFAAQVAEIAGRGAAREVCLADGERIPCDTVVIGIGAAPRTALACAAGLEIAHDTKGIAVDERLATSDPDIFAAGDVTSFPHPLYGARIRLECWKNAEDQARVAARNMTGAEIRYQAVPWFWSDQYELSIQIAGLPQFGVEQVVRETADALLLFHLRADGALAAASGVGTGAVGRDVRIAQMLIERGVRVDAGDLADPSVRLKSLLAAVPA